MRVATSESYRCFNPSVFELLLVPLGTRVTGKFTRIWEFHFSPTTSEAWLTVSTVSWCGEPLSSATRQISDRGLAQVPRGARLRRWRPADRSRSPVKRHQVDETNRAEWSAVGRFSATPTEVLPWFSSVVRRIPEYNFVQRQGTARITLQAQRPHQSSCIQSRIKNLFLCHSGFKSQKASQPKYALPYICGKLMLNLCIPVSSLKLRRKTVSVSATRYRLESVNEPRDAVTRRNG
jgi:hypothetical protein